MKKTTALLVTAAICGACVFGATACGNENGFSVYAPDGAPALSLACAISKNDSDFSYHVVDSGNISVQVTGRNPQADFCIMPLNLASKLLGGGETYQMLGTVTNGNMYFLTTGENAALTGENLKTELLGKTVGVVQLSNVPGLTLQAVLNDYGADYQIVSSAQADKAADKVNLVAVDAVNVTPAFGCDYYLCPEPAATTKINATASAPKPFRAAGDLQELYGAGGYPQAVIVAKKSVISNNPSAVQKMVSYLSESAEYLETATPQTVLELLGGVRTEGLKPSFDANNLNATVISHCAVHFTAAEAAKPAVNAFLDKLIAINPASASAVSNDFFYIG